MLDPVETWLKNTISAATAADEDMVKDLLPHAPGLSLLAGRPGVGKTTLALQLGYDLSTGRDFLGLPSRRVKVGIICFEGAPMKMAERILKVAANYPTGPGDFLHFDMRAPARVTQKTIPTWEKLLTGMELVILDPLKLVVAGDYTKPAFANEACQCLLELARRLGAHILLVHHIRKPDRRVRLEPGDIFELKGAADYCEAATTVMTLERAPQGHKSRGWASADHDALELHIGKARDAASITGPFALHRDRKNLTFTAKVLETD